MLLFPERLPKEHTDAAKRKNAEESKHMVNGKNTEDSKPIKPPSFRKAMKRLLTNKVFMYNFGSTIFYAFAFMGFGTFMPKFFEYNFRMKASSTSGYTAGMNFIQ